MPIDLTCSCGRSLTLRDELAGKQIRCPECQATLTVPAVDAPPVVHELPEVLPVATAVTGKPPSKNPFEDLDNQLRDPNYVPRRTTPPPPKPSGGFGSINAGVGGGILMMVIAVVWFVVGLMNDWLFYYPPILFIIGLISFIKGLVQGSNSN